MLPHSCFKISFNVISPIADFSFIKKSFKFPRKKSVFKINKSRFLSFLRRQKLEITMKNFLVDSLNWADFFLWMRIKRFSERGGIYRLFLEHKATIMLSKERFASNSTKNYWNFSHNFYSFFFKLTIKFPPFAKSSKKNSFPNQNHSHSIIKKKLSFEKKKTYKKLASKPPRTITESLASYPKTPIIVARCGRQWHDHSKWLSLFLNTIRPQWRVRMMRPFRRRQHYSKSQHPPRLCLKIRPWRISGSELNFKT